MCVCVFVCVLLYIAMFLINKSVIATTFITKELYKDTEVISLTSRELLSNHSLSLSFSLSFSLSLILSFSLSHSLSLSLILSLSFSFSLFLFKITNDNKLELLFLKQ